jgi:glycosyltransferase involved in cell wall biosynthesis
MIGNPSIGKNREKIVIYALGNKHKMDNSNKLMRVLWFAPTPGLCAEHVKVKAWGGGWISSLQLLVEKRPDLQLGLVFYADKALAPFEFGKTWYYPVQKTGSTKRKRLVNRLKVKTEYEENLPNFLKAIELFKPDIIHIWGTEFSYGLIVRELTDIPVVVYFQGNLTVYEKKYFSGMGMPGLIRRLLSGYPFFNTDYKIWQKRGAIEREILRKTDFIFGRTEWDRRVSLALAPGARYFYLHDVIRPGFYELNWQPVKNAVPVFLTTSSPSFYKGFETLIETAKILTGNGVAFTWLVAGLKEDQPMVKLILQHTGIRVQDLKTLNIQLLGTLSEAGLAGHLLKCDVYVQVSHIENAPNSLAEAQLAGVPIVASFAGGTSSLLRDGEHGVLVQDGEPFSLAGALQEATIYADRHQAMAAEGRRVARQRHDPSGILSDMLAAYSEIIKKHAEKNRVNTP